MLRLRWVALMIILSFCALAAPALGATVTFLDENGAATAVYAEGSRAIVRVEDPAANVSPGVDTVEVQLTSSRAGDAETLTLTETGAATGVFRGEIKLAPGDSSQPGVLETAVNPDPPYDRDTIHAAYGPATATATMVGQKVMFLDPYGRPTTRLVGGQPVRVRVIAPLLNGAPAYEDGTVGSLTSASGDQEDIFIVETGPDTGVFEGEVPSGVISPAPNNSVIEAFQGQTITVETQDPDAPTTSRATATLAGDRVELVDAQGKPADFYLESSRVYVEVMYQRGFGLVQAQVTADLSGDSEVVNLQETGAGTGIYKGSIAMRRGPALASNGLLETTEAGPPYRFDTVRVTYGSTGAADAVPTIGSLTSFHDSFGNEVSAYAAGAPVTVRVEDHNFNNPGAIDSVQATVQSLSTGDAESLTLYETGRDTGLFEATVPTAINGAPSPNDGRLQVSPGETIQAMHVDAFPQLASGALARIDVLSIHFLDESGKPTTELLEGGVVRVQVVSPSYNGMPHQVETLGITLQTRFAGDQESLQLTETGPDTGIFEGTIRSTVNTAAPGDGVLQELNSDFPAYLPEEVTATLGDVTAVAHTVPSRMVFIDPYGRETTTVPLGGPVRLRVVAPDFNFDPNYQDGIGVHVTVPGDDEFVVVVETGLDTGIFEGSIDSSSGVPSINSNRLESSVGQTITATLQNNYSPTSLQSQAVFTGGQVAFVDEAGNAATVVLEGARARVRVVDHGADLHASADTVTATLTTELSGDQESLTLTETGPRTGIFEGTILVRNGPVLQNSGAIEPGEDAGPPHAFDAIHASYTAANNGGVSTAAVGTQNFKLWLIDAYGQVTSHYAERSRVYVRLEDHRNDDPGAVQRAHVIVTSSTGDQEPLELVETGRATGIYEGSLPLDSGVSPAADGQLQAGPGAGVSAVHDTGFTAEPPQAVIDSLSVAFIDEAGRPTTELLEGGLVRVRVVYAGADSDPNLVETLGVSLQTRFAGDQESLQLTETGPDTGIFEGTIHSTVNIAAPGDGTLQELNSDFPAYLPEEVTVTLLDATAVAHTVGGRMAFIDLYGRETAAVPLGGPVRLRVAAPDFNGDPSFVDSLVVELTVPGDDEFAILEETGPDTGIFEGSIDSAGGAPSINSNRLESSVGQTITATLGLPYSPVPLQKQAVFTGGQVTFVDDAGQLTSTVLAGTHARLRVEDHQRSGSAPVQVVTDVTGDQESVTLQETASGAGVFEGSLPVSTRPAVPNSGSLETGASDTLTATYADSAGFTSAASVGIVAYRVRFIDAKGQGADHFVPGSRVTVRIEKQDGTDPATVETLSARVRSSSGDEEVMTLTETGASTGIFEGSILLDSSGAPAVSDGKLQAALGDEITADLDGTQTPMPARASIGSGNGPTITFLDLADQAATSYSLGGTARVLIEDPARSLPSVPVTVQSLTSGDLETVDAQFVSRGVYEIDLPITGAAGASGDGVLNVTPGEEIEARYGAVNTRATILSNRVPQTADDTGDTQPNHSVVVDVLANDSDPDGDPLTVIAVTQPRFGSVTINPDNTLTFSIGSEVFIGTEFFTYVVADPQGGQAVGNVAVGINRNNHRAQGGDDTATVEANGSVTINVLANDSDPDGDPLTVQFIWVAPAHGQAIPNDDSTVTYKPAKDFVGTDTFQYFLSDGRGGNAEPTVTVTVTPPNHPPVASNDSAAINQGGSATVNVLANDTDPDGDPLTVTAADGVINPDQTVTFTPSPTAAGVISFSYTISDGRGKTATASVLISVNALPVANADAATVAEDGTVDVAVLSNDTDPDNDPLSLASITQGSHGTVAINANGTVRYTPAANYNGPDSFTYTVSDSHGATATGTVSVTVTPVNDKPVANADSATLAEDGTVDVAVLANDTDADNDTLTVASVTQGAHGAVSINANGTVRYKPAANYNGPDAFTYTVSDGHGGTATGTVAITVTPVNDPPVANADTATVFEDLPTVVTVLSNDTDIDNDTLQVVSVTQGAHGGTVSINADGTLRYLGALNYNGPDSFTYTVSDGHGGTATGTVSITVTPVDDAPAANADAATVIEDGAVDIAVLANDTDVENDPLSLVSVTQGAHGTVVKNADGTVRYTPAPDYSGADSFTYTVSDGHGKESIGKVTVTVTPVNDPPVANPDFWTTFEDSPATGIPIMANDRDPDGDVLDLSVTQPAHGTVVIDSIIVNGIRTVTYTPAPNYNGPDSFTYTISDGHGGSATATVSMTVLPVNDGPTAVDDFVTVPEDGSVTFDVLANDSDLEGDPIKLSGYTSPAHGTLTLNADGTLTYQPKPNYHGADSFAYNVDDSNFGFGHAQVFLTVTSVNDPPTPRPDTPVLDEDSSIDINVLANDTDVDGDTLTVTAVTQGAHGVTAINPNQTVKYTPAANYNGSDSFTYTVSDGQGGTATGTVSIFVFAVNDPPVANADAVTVPEDGAVSVTVLANDTDVDGDTLTVTAVT
jgi:VCBS repeat-containing protein